MPQARRSTTTRASSRFKQPPALKRLTTSLDTAQKALADLSKGSGRDVGKGAGDLYKDLRSFVTSARRDSNKLAKALQREFDQAQKQLAKAASGARKSSSSSSRTSSARGTSKRSTTSGRSSSSRSTSSRSTAPRSTASRAASGRSTAKRSGTGAAKRSTGTRRGSSKS